MCEAGVRPSVLQKRASGACATRRPRLPHRQRVAGQHPKRAQRARERIAREDVAAEGDEAPHVAVQSQRTEGCIERFVGHLQHLAIAARNVAHDIGHEAHPLVRPKALVRHDFDADLTVRYGSSGWRAGAAGDQLPCRGSALQSFCQSSPSIACD